MLEKYKKQNKKNIQTGILIGIILLLIAVILWLFSLKNIAYIFLVAGILIIITSILEALNLKDIESSMSENELEALEQELNKVIMESTNHYVVTENGIFIPNKLTLIKYEDIILIYEMPRFNRDTVEVYINIITKEKERFKLPTYTTALTIGFEYYDLKEIIKKKNPKVLIGKNANHKKILQEKYQIKL